MVGVTLLWLAVLSLAFTAGCQRREIEILEADPAESREIHALGERLAGDLLEAMKGELMRAMEDEGPVEAMRICGGRAMEIAREVENSSERPVRIKRTSARYRNPENAPDAAELRALSLLEERPPAGVDGREHLVQKVRREGREYLRYYKPLTVGAICLNCHGERSRIPDGVNTALAQRYPDDLAVGYGLGDLRGALRIELELAESRP